MPPKKRAVPANSLQSFVRNWQTLFQMGVPLVGAVTFMYTTFATISMVKDGKNEQDKKIEQVRIEVMNHSDMNRNAMDLKIDAKFDALSKLMERITGTVDRLEFRLGGLGFPSTKR